MPRRRRSGGGTLALALDRVGGELLRDQQVDEVLGKATAKTGQAAAEETDAAAAWSAGASGLATGGEAAGVQLEPSGS